MTGALITVSVVSHGHDEDILRLLADMAAFSGQRIAEVVVTFNMPERTLLDRVAAHDWPFKVRLVQNPKPLGYSANHNQAFVHCQTPFFCVVNPDIRLARDPFASLLQALQASDAGCAYPWHIAWNAESPVDPARELPTPQALLRRYTTSLQPRYCRPLCWVNGAFLLFKTSAYEQIGGFDAGYFMYCEDVDICLRLQQSGWRLVGVPEAVVQHRASHASRRNLRHLKWHLQSLKRLWGSDAYAQACQGARSSHGA